MPQKKPKRPAGRRTSSTRAPRRRRQQAQDVERPPTAPEVTMSDAEIDRFRDRLRRKFH